MACVATRYYEVGLLGGVKGCHDFAVERCFGCDDGTLFKGVASIPAGNCKACTFKAGQDGRAVPDLHHRITHDIDKARAE